MNDEHTYMVFLRHDDGKLEYLGLVDDDSFPEIGVYSYLNTSALKDVEISDNEIMALLEGNA